MDPPAYSNRDSVCHLVTQPDGIAVYTVLLILFLTARSIKTTIRLNRGRLILPLRRRVAVSFALKPEISGGPICSVHSRVIGLLLIMTLSLIPSCTNPPPTKPRSGYPEPELIVPFHPIVGVWQLDRTCDTPFAFCRYPEFTRSVRTIEFGNDSIYWEREADTINIISQFVILPIDSANSHERVDIKGNLDLADIYIVTPDTLCLSYRESQIVHVYSYFLRIDSLYSQ